MRYSPKGADDIHGFAVMIYQACGLDKQKENFCLVDKSSLFVGVGDGIRTHGLQGHNLAL